MAPTPNKFVMASTATAVALVLFAGCAVGPNFERPAAPNVPGYASNPIAATSGTAQVAGGEPQRFVSGLDLPGQWWTLFQSKALDELVRRSLENNPDIKAAQAALLVARENVLAQRGAYYPSADASLSASRQKTSADLSPTPNSNALNFSLYTQQVGVSYVPDVFGLNRRTIESLEAQAEQLRYAWAATDITLSANVVNAAIQEAALRAQIDATRELIAINTNMLSTLRRQSARGYVGGLDVAAQESQLAQVSATLPPLLRQLAQQRDLLAALSGGFPSQGVPEKFELADLKLPEELPVSLPSQLVRQRPDVLQAEENQHAASAQVGIAVANRLPSFTLTADLGTTALAAGSLFAAGKDFWDLGAGVTQPLFRGGSLLHQERAARAVYVQATEKYRSVVLTAFQNVADTLNALQHDADALDATAAAKAAAGVTLDLARKQWQSGYANYLTLLNAEQTYQQAVISLIQAQAARYADSVALFQALGGGWWNREDIQK
jgi:NodT family efflux transporter outer membrane factor (OMF) lipoprotein